MSKPIFQVSDSEIINVELQLHVLEKWARGVLHDEGYADQDIDKLISMPALEPGRKVWFKKMSMFNRMSDHHFALMELRQIEKVRAIRAEVGQQADEWISHGWNLGWLQHMGYMESRSSETLNRWRRLISKKPRNRNTISKRVMKYMPSDVKTPGDFKAYVGNGRTLHEIRVEIEPSRNKIGAVNHYSLLELDTGKSESIKPSSISTMLRRARR